jgi:sugar diacid utilization regulator
VRVDELLRAAGATGVTLVAGPWDARRVEQVMIVDELSDIDRAPRGCLAILTRHASTRTAGYELDIVLRRAGDRELAAVALYGPATTSVTAIRLADRSRVALLAVSGTRDLSELAFELEMALRSGADAMLRRIVATLAVVRQAEEVSLGSVLAAASEALGVAVRYAEAPEGAVTVPVVVGGRAEGWVCTEAGDAGMQVGCQLVADALARLRMSLRASRAAAARAQAEAIADVLRAPDGAVGAAAERARLLEVAVEGRHGVVALAGAEGSAQMSDPLVSIVRRIAEEVAPECHVVSLDECVLMVRTVRPIVQGDGPLPLVAVAQSLLERVLGGRRTLELVCGVSGEHDGVEGLRTAVSEARGAVATGRAEDRANTVLSFDASPLRRLLAEISASPAARSSIEGLLAPLDQLGDRRALIAIATLQVYLDERGSLKESGRRLHLHPNAVAYRIKQIRGRLDVDLDDPEQRLALQVACRTRLMGAYA